MKRGKERRRYSRRAVQMGLQFRRLENGVAVDKSFTFGKVVELSMGGMKIEVPDRFFKSVKLEILIHNSEDDNVFHGLVEVVRFAGELNKSYLYGARTRMLKRL